MMTGNVLSSTGDLNNLVAAEQLFQQARDLAQNPADKALACFNLFQIRLRYQDYHHALEHLQTALTIDGPHYALHDVDRYPIIRLLGAGGMGCVFLCHDQWRENQVVVKCFWEGRKGSREEVFGEAMLMRTIAGDYVPKPLDCGYVDATRQERPYFVTEYIEGAEDGETWLAQHGELDVPTGLAVGLQIAKGLQVAHEQGIYHLDLKPANLLFKPTDTGLLVKIIDFGLARVATSLRQEAMSRRISDQQTQFGQMIIGTLSYAPPEQLGQTEYGPPSAKSDLFSFAATLYRLMTGESPHNLNPRRLSDAPPTLFELLCDCKEENPARRPETIQQVISILAGIQAKVPKKTEVDTLMSDLQRHAQRQAEEQRQVQTSVRKKSVIMEQPVEVITVSHDGDCQTISAAIRMAKAGSRILVKPGVYEECLLITKPLEIIGEGEIAEIIVENRNRDCILMKTDKALVRGLTLRSCAAVNNKQFCAVSISQGKLTLEHCDITSDSSHCVNICGSQAEGILRDCKIHDGKQIGVQVYNNATGLIENCDIFGNKWGVVTRKTSENLVIQSCQIHDSKESGVFVGVNSTGRIENCDIFGNHLGIYIGEGGGPIVQYCKIYDSKSIGIFCENGEGQVENCDIFGNIIKGISIRESGNLIVQHCQIFDNQEGITCMGKGQIENCDIFGNRIGIESNRGGNPIVQHCQIHDNTSWGILISENCTGQIENCNILRHSTAGITIHGGNLVVQKCTINQNKKGVSVQGGATIEDCDLQDNAKGAWEIFADGKVVLRRNKE